MKRRTTLSLIAVTACGFNARSGYAQAISESSARAADPASVEAPSRQAAPAAAPSEATPGQRNWAVQFLRDVGGDYVHFFSKGTAVWLGVGGLAALAVHPADDNLSEWALENDPSLTGGETYGSQWLHLPVALVVWGVGAAAGSNRVADAGRDLLRAQIGL